MKLVNAGIKSKKELATRLMNGEVFWSRSGLRVYYEDKEDSPFRVGCKPIHTGWREYRDLKKEVLWYKNIEKPTLCWVSNVKGDDNQQYGSLRLIINATRVEGTRYTFTSVEGIWKYATLVSQEELKKWVLA